MKSKNYTSTYILWLLLAASSLIKAQQLANNPGMETMTLFTDRTLYISGEQLHFSAFLFSNNKLPSEISRILYAEIISPDGKSITGNKYPITNHAAEGCIVIPEDIITGVYYLRAYTKYMRNFGPEAFSYTPIKIVNPLLSDVLEGRDTLEFSTEQGTIGSTSDTFSISTDKQEYAPRENVTVKVKSMHNSLYSSASWKNLSVSVVPISSSSSHSFPHPENIQPLKSMAFYPETRGVSLTGEVKDGSNGHALTASRVNLSIIGQGRDFMAVNTDSDGRFFFSLPSYSGFKDLFLCSESDSISLPQLLVDNDFSSVPFHLPNPDFKLSAEERASAYAMALNVRISKYFSSDTIPCSNVIEATERAFYGESSEIIQFAKYVQLPTLEEYFNEVTQEVGVRKRHGRKYFKVMGTRPEMTYHDPLVLIDWVAINNPEKILAIPPTSIARIEVINVPYVKGDITYGGIVSIISKRGDFGGIDLPASGIFLSYEGIAETCHCQIRETPALNVPDIRNTLYWNPNLAVDQNQDAHFSFTTPDTPGRYTIVLKGINNDGHILKQTSELTVK